MVSAIISIPIQGDVLHDAQAFQICMAISQTKKMYPN